MLRHVPGVEEGARERGSRGREGLRGQGERGEAGRGGKGVEDWKGRGGNKIVNVENGETSRINRRKGREKDDWTDWKKVEGEGMEDWKGTDIIRRRGGRTEWKKWRTNWGKEKEKDDYINRKCGREKERQSGNKNEENDVKEKEWRRKLIHVPQRIRMALHIARNRLEDGPHTSSSQLLSEFIGRAPNHHLGNSEHLPVLTQS